MSENVDGPYARAWETYRRESKLVESLDKLSTLAEATAGYRTKLVASGISATVADEMAAEYHKTLLDLMAGGIKEVLAARAAARTALEQRGGKR